MSHPPPRSTLTYTLFHYTTLFRTPQSVPVHSRLCLYRRRLTPAAELFPAQRGADLADRGGTRRRRLGGRRRQKGRPPRAAPIPHPAAAHLLLADHPRRRDRKSTRLNSSN